MKKFILIVGILVVGIIILFVFKSKKQNTSSTTISPSPNQTADSIEDPARVTKVFFGTYVTPTDSPIQPERFTGYHTGDDFETTPAEANIAVPVPAFCDGKLLLKEWASGYGGVAVESCVLNNQAVTIIYGHLNIASVTPVVGQTLQKGDFIGDLGQGYSTQTDGERKHLHLGIHIGTAVNILGYVPNKSDLSGWLDPMQFLK